MNNLYTFEKLRQLDDERLSRKRLLPPDPQKPRRKPLFGLAATTGRTLRRFGEGLESWGAPPRPENDQPMQGGAC